MGEQLQQELLSHMIPEDALTADVARLGGPYKVGKKLRPELEQKAARDWLLNCLNPNHNQNLTQAQIALIVTWARAEGSTYYAEFWAVSNNMTKPIQIQPEDEKLRIQRLMLRLGGEMKGLFAELEKLG